MATSTILIAPSCALMACTYIPAARQAREARRVAQVKFTVINIVKKYGSKTNIAIDINKEPVLKDLFSPKVSSG